MDLVVAHLAEVEAPVDVASIDLAHVVLLDIANLETVDLVVE